MPRFLIEVPHKNAKRSCDLAVEVFRDTGSHFLTNADFGCKDGVHKSWINVKVDSKREALQIVPPPFRDKAKAIAVEKLALDKIHKTLKHHKD